MSSDTSNPSIYTLQDVLVAAGLRPPDVAATREERHKLSEGKRVYATRFADKMAICVANGLRERFPGVLPDESGRGVESPAQSVRGPKKLDVNYSTPRLGLGFGVSLKAVHFREKEKRGYIHNLKRNDEELRSEASGYHQRQPYAVMVAVMFLPSDSCDDATARHSSSFGAWVMGVPCLTLRDNTERPETVEVGTNELVGTDPDNVRPALKRLMAGGWKKGKIPEKWDGKAAERIVQALERLLA